MPAGWLERMARMLQPRPPRPHKSKIARPVKCGPWHLSKVPLVDRDPRTLTHAERKRRRFQLRVMGKEE